MATNKSSAMRGSRPAGGRPPSSASVLPIEDGVAKRDLAGGDEPAGPTCDLHRKRLGVTGAECMDHPPRSMHSASRVMARSRPPSEASRVIESSRVPTCAAYAATSSRPSANMHFPSLDYIVLVAASRGRHPEVQGAVAPIPGAQPSSSSARIRSPSARSGTSSPSSTSSAATSCPSAASASARASGCVHGRVLPRGECGHRGHDVAWAPSVAQGHEPLDREPTVVRSERAGAGTARLAPSHRRRAHHRARSRRWGAVRRCDGMPRALRPGRRASGVRCRGRSGPTSQSPFHGVGQPRRPPVRDNGQRRSLWVDVVEGRGGRPTRRAGAGAGSRLRPPGTACPAAAVPHGVRAQPGPSPSRCGPAPGERGHLLGATVVLFGEPSGWGGRVDRIAAARAAAS